MASIEQTRSPKPGIEGPREVDNYVALSCCGTSSNNRGQTILLVAKMLNVPNVYASAVFQEKSGSSIRRIKVKLMSIGKHWLHPRLLFYVITGQAEEYVKDPRQCLGEYGTWHMTNVGISKRVREMNSKFGGTVVDITPVGQGGHFLVWLDQQRALHLVGAASPIRIGWLIEPVDKKSLAIYSGIVHLLSRINVVDGMLVTSNRAANEGRTVEMIDSYVATWFDVTLARRKYSQHELSPFDILADLFTSEDGKMSWVGASADVRENPSVIRKPFFLGLFQRKGRYKDVTIEAVRDLVRSVLYNSNTDLTRLEPVPDSPVYVALTGYANLEDEVIPALQEWLNDSRVNICFLPSDPAYKENRKLLAVAFRKVRKPQPKEDPTPVVAAYKKYLKIVGASDEEFCRGFKRNYNPRAIQETEDKQPGADVVRISNEEDEP